MSLAINTITPKTQEALDLSDVLLDRFKGNPDYVGALFSGERFAQAIDQAELETIPTTIGNKYNQVYTYTASNKDGSRQRDMVQFNSDNAADISPIRYGLREIQHAVRHMYKDPKTGEFLLPYISFDNNGPFVRKLNLGQAPWRGLLDVINEIPPEKRIPTLGDFAQDPYAVFKKLFEGGDPDKLTKLHPLLFHMAVEDSPIEVRNNPTKLDQLGNVDIIPDEPKPGVRQMVRIIPGNPSDTTKGVRYGLDEIRKALQYPLVNEDGTYTLMYISQRHHGIDAENPLSQYKARRIVVTKAQLDELNEKLGVPNRRQVTTIGSRERTLGDMYGNQIEYI